MPVQRSQSPDRFHSWIAAGAVASAAVALSLYFFSPRFILWRLLGSSETPPETVRAVDGLRQLADPFVAIDGTNRVLEWRLLFPILGHFLHLPAAVYLALPQIGALVALVFVARVLRDRGFGLAASIGAAVVVATTPWFFVSAGWLGYFDSWCMLGLLLVAFARSRNVALAAILATPWVDERFVLTLPLVVMLRRWDAQSRDLPPPPMRELLLMAAALAPWGLVRGIAYLRGSDTVVAAHFGDIAAAHATIGWRHYASGLWEGARWGWLAIAGLLVVAWRKSPGLSAGIAILLVATLGENLAIAEDLSRSASVVVPALLAGLIALPRIVVSRAAVAVAVLAGLNLFTPARHVIGSHSIPILYFPGELHRNENPLGDFNAQLYYQSGLAQSKAGLSKRSIEMFDLAIRLDPDNIPAISNRALQKAALKEWVEAISDFDHALRLDPDQPDLWLSRGLVRGNSGDMAGARSDFEEALRLAGNSNWEPRARVLELLGKLKEAGPTELK